jgi:GNAT superfamily N-acetyltransferase
MWWRQTAREFSAGKGESNRKAFKALVDAGERPGLLAYIDGEAVGWCAVAPRQRYPRLERSPTLKPIDDQPVWSITCFFVAKPHRKRGLTIELVRSALEFVRQRGGRIVEAYPIDAGSGTCPPTSAYTGLLSTFLELGFVDVSPSKAARRRTVRRTLD